MLTKSGRPFAVFDIDGTLIRWQLYHAIADALVKQGSIDPAAFEKVRAARLTWKKRASETSFDTYERTLVKLIETATIGLAETDLQQACQNVLAEYKDQVYTYTRDLIQQLKNQGYLLFAISGSQDTIVKQLADYYGFDDADGSSYEVKGGRFTGKNTPLRRERKPEFLKQLVAKHQADWQGSIGVGDSESDIPMLSLVERPIAFNPSKVLFQHASKQGWSIVLERKNVVYQLEQKHGSYLLA